MPRRAGGLTRRRFVLGAASAGTLTGLGALGPGAALAAPGQVPTLSGSRFDLAVQPTPMNVTGRQIVATGVNGSIPGPILRWRQGDTVTLNVTNRLSVPTSIHWHGIRSPSNMDGVPGLSFRGIPPGETFTYRIPLRQSGTYWYHSHSGFQEQTGVYGALVVEPRDGYPVAFDRDYVVLLSDWTDDNPEVIVSNLKFQSDYYNFHQRTVGTFFADVARHGLSATIEDRLQWGRMRMSPTDIADVTGYTYTYLLNGQPPGSNWTALFRPGERVRLRFINGATMTFFDVRIPGLKMSVVEADGNSVVPVEIDEFRIGVAETYDVIVQPREDRAYTVFAQSMDRTGFARGTLATRPGIAGPIPPMDPRPIRTMVDMGMGRMDMGGGMSGMTGHADTTSRAASDRAGGGANGQRGAPRRPTSGDRGGAIGHAAVPAPAMTQGNTASGGMPGMDMGGAPTPGMGHGSMAGMNMGGGMPGMGMPPDPTAARLRGQPGVDNVAMMPMNRLSEAGDGLDGNGRRVLTYADLRAVIPGDDPRPPSREIVLHLTGNMERYVWGFDGRKFSQAEPIRLKLGERVRFILINDTMMEHPIHLHGLWSELENGHGNYRPYKHTIVVKPGERLSYLVTADEPGAWAYHCHLLYHMEMGMFRAVVVE
ncbi:copper resistance system multicopper oxidase [Dankookia rubra]|uniref:copper resistance system multicopper oxidase n=1 Tax=Dankookia rubra TaxID=1442381 RepID=UPI00240D07EC|nr:copper resistance system multicopper oxidase [Dankookia rubra]